MKKMMRRAVALVMALAMVLSVSALAAEAPATITNIGLASYQFVEVTDGDGKVYHKITGTYTNDGLTEGAWYSVILFKGAADAAETMQDGNIVYINQFQAASGKLDIEVFPDGYPAEGVIVIAGQIGGTSQSVKVATVKAKYTPGDVNNDGKIDMLDALLTVQYYFGKTPEKTIREAANVNNDSKIDMLDALLVVQLYLSSK